MQTKTTHRKDTFWQIWLPLIVSVLLILALAVVIVVSTVRDTSGDFNTKWSSISLVYLSLPTLLLALIVLILLAGLIYLLVRLYQWIPGFSLRVTDFMNQVSYYARLVCDKSVSPIVFVRSKYAGLNAILKKTKPEEN